MIEVLKQALEALEYWDIHGGLNQPTEDAITSLRKAIQEEALRNVQRIGKEIEQEPVDYERGFIDGMQKQMQSSVDKAVNAMTQRTWVGLTEDEAFACRGRDYFQTYRAIDAKLKEKNT
jgi:hypothetical protein